MKAAFASAILLMLPVLAAATGPIVRPLDAAPRVVAAAGSPASAEAWASPPAAPLRGPQPFITILCKFADVANEPKPPAFYESAAGMQSGLDRYWREVSYGQISLEGSRVAGWYALPSPAAAYQPNGRRKPNLDLLARDCTSAADAEVFFPDFTGINLVFNRALDGSAWGGRRCLELDGQSRCYGTTWLWPVVFDLHGMLPHEMGHAFGLQHSSAGLGEDYGSAWDVMSGSSWCGPEPESALASAHPIAPAKDLLGWIPADRKITVSAPGTITVELAALADPSGPGYLMVRVPVAGSTTRFYTVEARLRIGYDRALPADAVLIHEVTPARNPAARLINRLGDGDTRSLAGAWEPGDVFADANGGVAVAVERATATGFVVTIATGQRPWPLAPSSWGTTPAGEVRFAWRPVPGAEGYEIKIDGQATPWQLTRSTDHAETTVALAPGSYRWQVRALPDGEWTLPVRLVTGLAGRRWLPSEVVTTEVSAIRSGLAVASGADGEVTVAWADTTGGGAPVYVHAARRAALGWQLHRKAVADYDARKGSIPAVVAGVAGEVCGAWVDPAPARRPGQAAPTTAADQGPWFDCWEITADRPGASAGAPEGVRRETAERIRQVGTSVRATTPVIVLDRSGDAYGAWNGSADGRTGLYTAHRQAGKPWEPEERVAEAASQWSLWSPALAVDDRGAMHAIWADARGEGAGIYAATRSGSGWGEVAAVSDGDSGRRINPAIAVDAAGNTYAAWQNLHGCSGSDVSGDIEFAWQPAGGAWDRPVRVSADIGATNASVPVIAASSDGAAILVWEERSAGVYTLFWSYRPAGGSWEPKTPIPDATGNRLPASPALGLDADGNPLLTWLDTRGESPAIRLAWAAR